MGLVMEKGEGKQVGRRGLAFEIKCLEENIELKRSMRLYSGFEEGLLESYLGYYKQWFGLDYPLQNPQLLTKSKLGRLKRQRGGCVVCGRAHGSLQHIQPTSHGGKDIAKNRARLCFNCHNKVERLADEGTYLTPSVYKIDFM